MMKIGFKKLSKTASLSGSLAKKPSKGNSDLSHMIQYKKQQSPCSAKWKVEKMELFLGLSLEIYY